jgi:hypothetical protein
MARALVSGFPAGTLVDFAGNIEPAGWFLCDGRAISRTVYANLFTAIGTAYGIGDGSTTFNLPDFRGRFARYNDNMSTGAGAAGRDTGRVHGSAQTQATAKNGLGGSANSGVNLGHSHIQQIPNGSFGVGGYVGANAGPIANNSYGNTNIPVSSSSSLDHGHSLTLSGDAETRPINLSCNRIIKI